MNPLSLPRIALLLSVMGITGALAAAGARPAEACSLPAPEIKAWLPAAGATGVPTNAALWIKGAPESVTLTAGPKTITALVKRISPNTDAVQATPSEALAPMTKYVVAASALGINDPVTFEITTGAGPEAPQLTAPRQTRVTAAGPLVSDGNSCAPAAGSYRVSIEATAVTGAAFYQLVAVQGPEPTVLEVSLTPLFSQIVEAMPTPRYAVRPVAISGAGVDFAALPGQRAETAVPVSEDDDGDDDGGCSASGERTSPLALALGLGALGLMLSRRRRR
jgi:MYXO-CTERM domain-containing protein